MNTEFLEQIFFGNSLRNYLYFSAILLLGLLLKRVFSKLLNRLMFMLFKRLEPNTEPKVFIEMLLKPVEVLIILVIIYLSINQLDYPLNEVIFRRTNLINNVATLYELKFVQVVDKLFLLLFVISAFWILLRIIDFIANVYKYKASLTLSKSDDQMVPFIKELSKIVTVIFAFFVVLGSVFNLNVATIIAGLGIGGIAVALAAQDSLQNLLGSFTIFADKPFVVGDLIRIENYEGTVEKVGFRSTIIRTLDKTLVIIPNKKMVDSPLENLSLRNLRRMKFNIGLRYDTSVEVMKKISDEVQQIVNDHPATSDDTLVTFDSFGESSLNIQVLYFIQIVDYNEYMRIRQDLNYKIMVIVAENGADFAFPSRTVFHEYVGEKPPGGAEIV
ncbi:MAG: mechanosensitive ion channel family protein [Daejeonella sp.]|uniref:mechanosensitive ion channel family protein n=1 Tax=Daejeonella sp. TaxID=2805397 RepID=UPI00273699D8|nr:mechanosensitive ion channel family protein [Daejeonella sp.]MDP3466923.1 mechanosensitive ion channel family protein [Daejeonella sp.]